MHSQLYNNTLEQKISGEIFTIPRLTFVCELQNLRPSMNRRESIEKLDFCAYNIVCFE